MHSWRVLILPCLDHPELYAEYRFDEPWDGPNNSKLADRMPLIYRCPSFGHPDNFTSEQFDRLSNYVCPTGPGTAFDGSNSVCFKDITGGTSNVILVAEVSQSSVHWMQPTDLPAVEAYGVLKSRDYTHWRRSVSDRRWLGTLHQRVDLSTDIQQSADHCRG